MLDRKRKVARTFAHFRSEAAHAQAQAQSAKSFLAVWNRPKIVLQTLGKPASRLQSLDRELKVPRTFTHFRSDPAHAQEEAQSAKSFLAVWNRPKIVLQTLDKPASRLQSLDRELKVPRTFTHFRSDPAHAQEEAQSAKSFLEIWNRPKIVLQTLGKPASRLQSLDRDLKVPRTFTQFRSDPAHAQEDMTRRSGVNLEVPQRNAGLVAPHSLHIFYVRLSGINACKVISVKIRRRNCQK